jgi:ABC-type branched-subunit amino acid transport system ATPase component
LANGSTYLLDVKNLVTGYGKKEVIKGVSIDVGLSEIVTLIGHNGAGKTTLLKAIFGLIPIWDGELDLNGHTMRSFNPRKLIAQGVAYVPQGNRVFTELSVRENLEMGGVTLSSKTRLNEGIERAIDLFPGLKPRLRQRAGTLSGGEKQMLALSNALVLSPRLLLLDEPSLGLAPRLVSDALVRIKEVSSDLGTSVLIVEQKVREVLKIANRVYVLRNGRVSFSGPSTDLVDEKKLHEVYL